jgi:phosphatidate cytidylyltransferase
VRDLADPPITAMAATDRWSDLRKRTISAVVLAPLVLFCIWWGGLALTVLLLGGAFGMMWEWVALCGPGVRLPPRLCAMLAVVVATVTAALGFAGIGLAVLGGGAVVIVVLTAGMRRGWLLAAGVPYAGIGTIALLWLRADPAVGLPNLLFVLLAIWASDIGAYATGRLIGGPKLAPRVSPGKTWSGAIGGLMAAIAAGALLAWSMDGVSLSWRVVAVSALIGAVGQAGDLLESQIKRVFGVKDSGTLIPGHGGLLDRVDALLTAVPVAALLALAAGRGVVLWQ